MANKKYFVWKNVKCDGINPEWLEVLGNEFFKILKNENSEKRYFIKLVDEEEIIFLESTKENYVKWRKEIDRARHIKKLNMNYEKVSLDFIDKNEETLSLHEKLSDEKFDVENVAFNQLNKEFIERKFDFLLSTQRELLIDLFVKDKTKEEISLEKGVSHQAISAQYKRILEKIKKYFI